MKFDVFTDYLGLEDESCQDLFSEIVYQNSNLNLIYIC